MHIATQPIRLRQLVSVVCRLLRVVTASSLCRVHRIWLSRYSSKHIIIASGRNTSAGLWTRTHHTTRLILRLGRPTSSFLKDLRLACAELAIEIIELLSFATSVITSLLLWNSIATHDSIIRALSNSTIVHSLPLLVLTLHLLLLLRWLLLLLLLLQLWLLLFVVPVLHRLDWHNIWRASPYVFCTALSLLILSNSHLLLLVSLIGHLIKKRCLLRRSLDVHGLLIKTLVIICSTKIQYYQFSHQN